MLVSAAVSALAGLLLGPRLGLFSVITGTAAAGTFGAFAESGLLGSLIGAAVSAGAFQTAVLVALVLRERGKADGDVPAADSALTASTG